MNINPKFKIGQKVLIPAGTKTNSSEFLQDCEDIISDIQISITKKGVSIRYHVEKHWDTIFKEKMLQEIKG